MMAGLVLTGTGRGCCCCSGGRRGRRAVDVAALRVQPQTGCSSLDAKIEDTLQLRRAMKMLDPLAGSTS
jgi:hypothetical protein